jgi:acyl-CoA hydrolase
MPLAWQRAKRRFAHINPRMPRTDSSFRVPFATLEGYVEVDAPLLTYTDPEPGEVDRTIVTHAANLIGEGDTLQFGIGTIPLALAHALTSHRRLRLHTGMVTRSARLLYEAGALDLSEPVVTGVALGDESLYRYVAEKRRFRFVDVGQTHDAAALGNIARFVAVNSAVEIDLLGQVNSESLDGKLLAGAGGLPAFAQGALNSPGGRSLICLRATAAGGAVSRIVPRLREGAMCTLPRWLADIVVTEHGVARIRDLDLDARAEALSAIAAPEHRAALAEAWSAFRGKF